MAKYTGVHCPVCKKRFADGDDVVVCPVCGAPHHRACYRSLGHCALDELHIKGHTWKPEPVAPDGDAQVDPAAPGNVACAACGAHNPEHGLFCQVCGAPLKGPHAGQPHAQQPSPYAAAWQRPQQPADYATALGGVAPDSEICGVRARDIALFVGENSHYFLPRFAEIAERRIFSFNFCAFIFNFFYFFYRKMYTYGAMLLGLMVLTMVPIFFAVPEYSTFLLANIEDIQLGIIPAFTPTQHLWAWSIMPFMRFFTFGFSLLFAVFANRMYLAHVLHSVREIRARCSGTDGVVSDDRAYVAALSMRGHTSKAAVLGVLGGVLVGYFVICLLIVQFIQI